MNIAALARTSNIVVDSLFFVVVCIYVVHTEHTIMMECAIRNKQKYDHFLSIQTHSFLHEFSNHSKMTNCIPYILYQANS